MTAETPLKVPTKPRREGRELYYIDANGKKQDASLHAEMLNNEDVQKAMCKDAVERAMKSGLSRDSAERLYGWYRGGEDEAP